MFRSAVITCWSLVLLAGFSLGQEKPKPAQTNLVELTVKACEDFDVSGSGNTAAWEKTQWVKMQARPKSKHDYETRFKILYSKTGLYVLFDGADDQLTATKTEDYLDLWTEDVYECFFWTDERFPIYFEYEISPLAFELPILIPNLDGNFLGWRPWNVGPVGPHRQTRKATSARGGPVKSMGKVAGWTAEVFMPYDLFKPLTNVPPRAGTAWRANFYRMDYDQGVQGSWDWARVGESFHQYQAFGRIVFE